MGRGRVCSAFGWGEAGFVEPGVGLEDGLLVI